MIIDLLGGVVYAAGVVAFLTVNPIDPPEDNLDRALNLAFAVAWPLMLIVAAGVIIWDRFKR